VVEELVRTHDPESDVLDEPALDASRRTFPDAVGVDEHREHQGRVVGSTAAAVLAVLGIERRKVELGHHVEHEEGEVVLREPVSDRGRQQEQLIAIGLTKVDRHAPIVPRDPNRGRDGQDSCDSL
jgi:hypothetical protein